MTVGTSHSSKGASPGGKGGKSTVLHTALRITAAGIGLCMLLLLIILGLVFVGCPGIFEPPVSFEDRAWRETPYTDRYDAVRLLMVDSLIEEGHLDGATRTEVIELLGSPYLQSEGRLDYSLGPSGWGQGQYLGMTFDGTGHVAEVFVYSD